MIAIIIMESLLEKINRYWTLEWGTDSLRYHSRERRERAQFTLDTFCTFPSLVITIVTRTAFVQHWRASLTFSSSVHPQRLFALCRCWLLFGLSGACPCLAGFSRAIRTNSVVVELRSFWSTKNENIYDTNCALRQGEGEKVEKANNFLFPLFSFLVFCLVDLTFTFFFSSSLRYLSFKFLFSSFCVFLLRRFIVLIIKEDPRARQHSSEGENRSVSKLKKGKNFVGSGILYAFLFLV